MEALGIKEFLDSETPTELASFVETERVQLHTTHMVNSNEKGSCRGKYTSYQHTGNFHRRDREVDSGTEVSLKKIILLLERL